MGTRTHIFCFSIIFVLIVAIPTAYTKEIVKWVDENGKVHFGDRAPTGKEKEAEKITIQDPISNKPTKDIYKKNKEYQLRQEERKEQEKKKKQDRADTVLANKKAKKSKSKKFSDEDKRKFCRDTFRNNVKSRTECFNKI